MNLEVSNEVLEMQDEIERDLELLFEKILDEELEKENLNELPDRITTSQ